jgi:hypothetical protein
MTVGYQTVPVPGQCQLVTPLGVPPPGMFGVKYLFSMLCGNCSLVKYLFFNTLESKVLKTWSLRGLACWRWLKVGAAATDFWRHLI